MDSIDLSQDWDQWRAVVNTVMKFDLSHSGPSHTHDVIL
jgi:hypothetical protein